jgi:hypothetical protein
MVVISGGQTGADQAGLYAAKHCGVTTGGYAPAHYMTVTGPNLILKDTFDLVVIQGGYKKRTAMNVQASDCTLRFAYDFNSPGELCTLNAIRECKKSYRDFDLRYPITKDMIEQVGNWLIAMKYYIINIAGNTQRDNRDAYTPTYETVVKILEYIKKKELDKKI